MPKGDIEERSELEEKNLPFNSLRDDLGKCKLKKERKKGKNFFPGRNFIWKCNGKKKHPDICYIFNHTSQINMF